MPIHIQRLPWILRGAVVFAAFLLAFACGGPQHKTAGKKMIILGIDGMDPKFLEQHWEDLPNLQKLARQGDFKRLATTIPPQSPVAWSSVITGMDPGGHGIFDFVHRDPFNRMPFSSMAETLAPESTFEIGSYVIPLSSGEVRQRRAGTAFWKLLDEAGVAATVFRMPANFPPVECDERTLSGMGTPDMQGTFGTFTFATDDPNEKTRAVSGGRIVSIRLLNHEAEIPIQGPQNAFLKEQPVTTVTLKAYRDPQEPVARLDLGDQRVVLNEGEWSGWLRADFPLLGESLSSAGMSLNSTGIFRAYLRQVRPRFELYVSPVNIDPTSPDLPISTPADYSAELAREVGPFYTQGMAEDTSALREKALTLEQFLEQSKFVLEETRALFRYELQRFHDGLLFFYVSSVDQNAHMLWGRHDAELLEIYKSTDEMIGEAIAAAGDDTTLIVMSDHGFERFDRAVHLNTVLMHEGFLALDDPANTGYEELFRHVDWSRTQAYAMGLNGIYLNRLGREQGGIVAEGEQSRQIIQALRERLLKVTDPQSGERIIEELYVSEDVYKGYNLGFAPDIQVGYRPPFRASWQTPLGAVPEQAVVDNEDAWIGDHCIAPQFVPGVLLVNRKTSLEDPHLYDLTVTILREFGVAPTSDMIGRDLFE
jgi:predicted AlkP superfamily phosphohydrolase/phosphomutase